MEMKKVFRALTADCVEKRWIGDRDPVPKGWHRTIPAALAAYRGPGTAPKADA